jgi:hypothetical protein
MRNLAGEQDARRQWAWHTSDRTRAAKSAESGVKPGLSGLSVLGVLLFLLFFFFFFFFFFVFLAVFSSFLWRPIVAALATPGASPAPAPTGATSLVTSRGGGGGIKSARLLTSLPPPASGCSGAA